MAGFAHATEKIEMRRTTLKIWIVGVIGLVLVIALISLVVWRPKDEVTVQLVERKTGAMVTNVTVRYYENVRIPLIGLIHALPDSWRLRQATGQIYSANGTFRVRRIKKWSTLEFATYTFYSDDTLVGKPSATESDDDAVGATFYNQEGFEQQVFSLTVVGVELKEVPPSGRVTLTVPGKQRNK